jgi:hypothetical protein
MENYRGRATSGASPRSNRTGDSHRHASVKAGDAVQVHTVREIEREFDYLESIWSGKETESNWEKREEAFRRLGSLFKSYHGENGWGSDSSLVEAVSVGVRKVMDDLLSGVRL